MVHVYGTDDVIHVCDRYPHTEPIPSKNTCGEWEPPEGRVCGTCEWWANPATNEKARYCLTRPIGPTAQLHGWADTCPAWRWTGPSPT
jgi:hypothetical protein